MTVFGAPFSARFTPLDPSTVTFRHCGISVLLLGLWCFCRMERGALLMLFDDRGSLPVPPLTGRGAWTRRLRRLTTILLLLIVFGAWAWIAREPLLRGAADLWVVSDPVTHADAVVVLGEVSESAVRGSRVLQKGFRQ
jgi:hypothetical protein